MENSQVCRWLPKDTNTNTWLLLKSKFLIVSEQSYLIWGGLCLQPLCYYIFLNLNGRFGINCGSDYKDKEMELDLLQFCHLI